MEKHNQILNNKRRILIVEDNEINREILKEFLTDDYEIIEACDGLEGIELLRQNYRTLSLVLLDLQMPRCDGIEFLKLRGKDTILSTVPVIVATSNTTTDDEINALTLGANDFVGKPYNVQIVLRRIRNVIRLSEAQAIRSEIEFDDLTGLYTRKAFFHHADSFLLKNEGKEISLLVSDVMNFKMINERFGFDRGDDIIRIIGESVKPYAGNAIVGRIGPDQFAMVYMDAADKNLDKLKMIQDDIIKAAKIPTMEVKFGIVNGITSDISSNTFVDWALYAAKSISNQYGKFFAYYDNEMRNQVLRKNRITETCTDSLEREYFKVFYQPKHDAITNKIIGAEALIRWIHPEFGFMSPGDFIPVFEANGFIVQLDYYVWKKVCENLRKWIDHGIPVVPISVNASRMDFYNPNYADVLLKPVKELDLDPKLVHLEVTESIFTDNSTNMIHTTERLRENGIMVEMDDFGSGYSSLNMLSVLPVDIVKFDMRFMGDIDNKKNQLVLKSSVSLAKNLDFKTTAEGVETEEQVQFVKGLGIDSIQGYYFSKPLSEEEFVRYLIEFE